MQVRPDPFVHPVRIKGFGPLADGFAVHPFQRPEVALELRSGVFERPSVIHRKPKIPLRMGQHGLEAFGDQPTYFSDGNDIPHLRRIVDGQFY